MDIGIGLPNTLHTSGPAIIDWTCRAEVSVLIGGTGDAAVRRVVNYEEGWTAAGGGPEAAAPVVAKVREAGQEAGREGEPRMAALVYFGLGDDEASNAALRRNYGFPVDRLADAVL